MENKSRFLNYSRFKTVLLAPQVFRDTHSAECKLFDHFLSYEDLSAFLPGFGEALARRGGSI